MDKLYIKNNFILFIKNTSENVINNIITIKELYNKYKIEKLFHDKIKIFIFIFILVIADI